MVIVLIKSSIKGKLLNGLMLNILLVGIFTTIILHDSCNSSSNKSFKSLIKSNKVKTRKLYEHYFEFGKPKQEGSLSEFDEFDEQGNEIAETHYWNDRIDWKHDYRYDKAGNQIERIEYEDDGSIRFKKVLQYNSANKRISKVWYDSFSKIVSEGAFTYNNNGKLINQYWYGPEDADEETYQFVKGSFIDAKPEYIRSKHYLNYFYDNNGRLKIKLENSDNDTSRDYSADSASDSYPFRSGTVTSYIYNKSGKLVQEITRGFDSRDTITYTRNNKQLVTKEDHSNKFFGIVNHFWFEMEYDQFDNVVSETRFSGINHIDNKHLSKFKENGLKTEETEFTEMNEPYILTTYEYVYY